MKAAGILTTLNGGIILPELGWLIKAFHWLRLSFTQWPADVCGRPPKQGMKATCLPHADSLASGIQRYGGGFKAPVLYYRPCFEPNKLRMASKRYCLSYSLPFPPSQSQFPIAHVTLLLLFGPLSQQSESEGRVDGCCMASGSWRCFARLLCSAAMGQRSDKEACWAKVPYPQKWARALTGY